MEEDIIKPQSSLSRRQIVGIAVCQGCGDTAIERVANAAVGSPGEALPLSCS